MFQKRFNVAASRAKDQMWVVHSLNPDVDLKPDDLRRRLILHAMDPLELTRKMDAAEVKAESEFERQVIRRLVAGGYRVRPQWKVGYYRIDMVVVGASANLAVECDGDRFHTLDQLQNDILRQSILERRGWRFFRIRGSEFFRTPDSAMQGVFEAIERLGIEKLGIEGETSPTAGRNTKLIDRLRLRACEISRQWKEAQEETPGESVDDAV